MSLQERVNALLETHTEWGFFFGREAVSDIDTYWSFENNQLGKINESLASQGVVGFLNLVLKDGERDGNEKVFILLNFLTGLEELNRVVEGIRSGNSLVNVLNQLLGWERKPGFVLKTLDGIGLGLIKEAIELKELMVSTGFARTLLILHAIAATRQKADYKRLTDTFSRMRFGGTRKENGNEIVLNEEAIKNFACSFRETPLSQIPERFDDVISWLQQGAPADGLPASGLKSCPTSDSLPVAQEIPHPQ
jgi:hypothetical protein